MEKYGVSQNLEKGRRFLSNCKVFRKNKGDFSSEMKSHAAAKILFYIVVDCAVVAKTQYLCFIRGIWLIWVQKYKNIFNFFSGSRNSREDKVWSGVWWCCMGVILGVKSKIIDRNCKKDLEISFKPPNFVVRSLHDGSRSFTHRSRISSIALF